jgi:hypothetical protein
VRKQLNRVAKLRHAHLRNLLRKIHIYGGLICSSYLVIFGVSSLNFNHEFGKGSNKKVTWERSLKILDMENNMALSESVRDSLGLFGWPLPWETRRDEQGNFHFGISRPGKHYSVSVFFAENRIAVVETRKGFWPVVNSLHAVMGVPSSPFMSLWGAYTELCTWVVLFSAASGIYLWTHRQKERLVGWVLLLGASGTSLLFMVYVWWRG